MSTLVAIQLPLSGARKKSTLNCPRGCLLLPAAPSWPLLVLDLHIGGSKDRGRGQGEGARSRDMQRKEQRATHPRARTEGGDEVRRRAANRVAHQPFTNPHKEGARSRGEQ